MEKVYIVTSGHYSDYGINGVFSTQEKAERYVEMLHRVDSSGFYDQPTIEEWDLDKIDEVPYGCDCYMVRINKRGDCEIETEDPLQASPCHYDYKNNLVWNIIAKDKEHAAKIANEKRTQILAINKWGDQTYLNELVD